MLWSHKFASFPPEACKKALLLYCRMDNERCDQHLQDLRVQPI